MMLSRTTRTGLYTLRVSRSGSRSQALRRAGSGARNRVIVATDADRALAALRYNLLTDNLRDR
jgi:hypothetical protein